MLSIYLCYKAFSQTNGLKIAKIISIFKAEDPNFFANYRPISLLSNFSKFFEKVIYNRLVEFAKTSYTLLLSVWISEKSLNITHTNSFGK